MSAATGDCWRRGTARPAMEAGGIDVFATVRRHGFAISVVRARQDEQYYFNLVLKLTGL